MLANLLLLILVSFLWGATNPLIRHGSREIKFLITRWKYVIPFLLNQLGSLIFVVTLQNVDLSIAVPVTNSLTFVFTALTAHLLGENSANRNTYIGATLIAIGSTLCMLDKI